MAVTSKKARRERSWFILQFEVSHEESQRLVSWSEPLLRRPINRSKATRNGWMEIVFTKRTQANIYNSVTLARNSTYGFFFFPFDVAYIYVQFLMNARNSFRFRSLSISKVSWWNKRECVTVVETKDIIASPVASKRFIYSLSLKFREQI